MLNRPALLFVLVLIFFLAANAPAQSKANSSSPDNEEKGLASYISFGGTSNSDGQVYRLDSSLGYNFNRHFGVDIGLPIYFVRASTSVGGASNNSIGNPYVDMRLKFVNPVVNYGSMLIASAPAGDSRRGMSTGRATFDWIHHFDHSFSRVTPFLEAGISNTIADSRFFIRPYTTLGLNSHFQAGTSISLAKYFSVGASGYDILPIGQQTVFSKLVGPSGSGGNSSHGRVFQDNQQTTGTADIARDHGFSAWVGASPSAYLDMELGYTRSIRYDLNSVSFSVGLNLGYLYRKSGHQ